jgi:hypothetical protein
MLLHPVCVSLIKNTVGKLTFFPEREREREREKGSGVVVRDTKLGPREKYILSFEGSQAVPARPSGRDKACDHN